MNYAGNSGATGKEPQIYPSQYNLGTVKNRVGTVKKTEGNREKAHRNREKEIGTVKNGLSDF